MNVKLNNAPVHTPVVPDTANAVNVSPITDGEGNSPDVCSLPKLKKHGTDRLNVLLVTEEDEVDKCLDVSPGPQMFSGFLRVQGAVGRVSSF